MTAGSPDVCAIERESLVPPAHPLPPASPGAVPSYEFETHMLHLVSWPQLIHLPQEQQPTVARICALLERRPSAGSLVPVLLGRSRSRVMPLIESLCESGHVQVVGIPVAHEPHPQPHEQPEAHSLLGRLWHRLGFHD